MEWQFHSSGQSAVGIKTTHEEYIEFCKYHAPTPENLARREKERAELEKEKMQENFCLTFSKKKNIMTSERVAKLRKSSFAARFFVRKKEET